MLTFSNIIFGYNENLIFDNASITLYQNKLNFLVGESGAGKSTLLKILSKKISASKIDCNSMEWNHLSSDMISYQLIGYQLIDHGYMQNLTVKQNIEETKNAYHSSGIDEELIRIFNFERLMKKYPHQLSGGQKRILSVILTLIKNLPIIFLDEPTSSLDNETKEIFLNFLKHYAMDGHTVLLATNDEDIMGYADELICIENKKIKQMLSPCQKSFSIKQCNLQFPYRLKTFLYHQPWQHFILLCLILALSVFIGNSLYTTSDYCYFINAETSLLQQTYKNTAYVYYRGFVDSDAYQPHSLLLDENLKNELNQSSMIKKVYPYYAIPLGDIMTGIFENGDLYEEMILSSETLGEINITDDNFPFLEFYYPEQLEGEKIYISDNFLTRYNATLDDVKNISLDMAIPIDIQEGDVVQILTDSQGKDVEVPISSIKQIYRKKTVQLSIDDTHHVRSEMYYLSQIPLIYAPSSMINALIDCTSVLPNAYTIILNENADINAVRDIISNYDDDLIFYYPAQSNQQTIEEFNHWKNDQIQNHVYACIKFILIVLLFLFLLESLNQNDYLYLRYSGLSKQRYIKYRMLEALIIVSIISILSLIYAFVFKEFTIVWFLTILTYGSFIVLILILYFIFMNLFCRHYNI